MSLSNAEVTELLTFLGGLDVAEVEVTIGDVHLLVRRQSADGGRDRAVGSASPAPSGPAPAPAALPPAAPGPVAPAPAPAAPAQVDQSVESEWTAREAAGEAVLVRAPMAGTFFRAKEPGAPPFVEIGSKVQPGDVVCLTEVMKLFHSLTAGAAGSVAAIFVADGQAIAKDQPLVAIVLDAEPDGR